MYHFSCRKHSPVPGGRIWSEALVDNRDNHDWNPPLGIVLFNLFQRLFPLNLPAAFPPVVCLSISPNITCLPNFPVVALQFSRLFLSTGSSVVCKLHHSTGYRSKNVQLHLWLEADRNWVGDKRLKNHKFIKDSVFVQHLDFFNKVCRLIPYFKICHLQNFLKLTFNC